MTGYRQIAIMFLVFAGFSALPSMAGPIKNRIFAHWGDYNANKKMLELAGYDFQGRAHDVDLSNGQQARLNEAVIAQTYEWYIAGNKTDAAGPGLYESSKFYDSATYGSDLLILEVHEPPPGYLLPYNEMRRDYDFNKLYNAGKMSEAPPFVKYSGTWHVIPRVPRPTEPVWTLRPPNANDVGRAWEQILEYAQEEANIAQASADKFKTKNDKEPYHKEKLVTEELAKLAPVAKMVRPLSKTSATRSAEIFLDRLFYDLGYNYLTKTTLPLTHSLQNDSAKIDTYLKLLGSIFKISNEYMSRLPTDSRTLLLRSFAIQEISSLNVENFTKLIGTTESSQALKEFCTNLDPANLKIVIRKILDVDPKTMTGETFANLAALKALKAMPIDDVVLIEDFVLANLPKTDPSKVSQIADLSGILNLLSKSEEGKKWIVAYAKDKVYGPEALGIISMLPGNTGQTIDMIFYAIQSSERPAEWARLLGRELLTDILDPRKPLGSERGNAFTAVLSGLNQILKDELPEYIKPIRARLAGPGGPAILRSLGDIQVFRVTNFLKDRDFQKIELLSKLLPEMIPNLIRSIETSILDPVIPLDHMKRMTVLTELKKKAGAALTPQMAAENLRAQFRPLFTKEVQALAKQNNVSLADFVKTQLPTSVFPVNGSLAYSELAKVFSLVDPIFVSEDIMVNNARAPQLRFNEDYNKDGQNYKQPAWENFIYAWAQLALRTFRSDPRLISPDVEPIELTRINSLLIAGYVDQGNKTEGINWTRSKYKTAFTAEEWKRYGGQPMMNELKRFFTISTEDGKTIMQFKSLEELKISMPGLSDIQPPKDNSQIAFFTSILTNQKVTDHTQDILFNYIESQTRDIKDPISKATRILYLMTKLHPAENGNGRLGRLWASVVLIQAGLPVPVGLPTNDFLMSEEHLRLEVRRSVANGKFYMAMLTKAQADGIAADDFFPKVFKGSALEGLVHVDVKDMADLKSYVNYLESLKDAPEWGKAFLAKVQGRITEMRKLNGALGRTSEVRRDMMLEDSFIAFRKETSLNFFGHGHSRNMCIEFYR